MNPDKFLYFEFVLNRLLDWYEQQGCGNRHQNDLSILKSLKLLFFVSAVRADVQNRFNLVDEVFDNFWAMPYGHVELSIYDHIKKQNGRLHFFIINDIGTRTIHRHSPEDLNRIFNQQLNGTFLKEIDQSISLLRKENPSLICMPAFALVDLSHSWYSWQTNYQAAQLKGSRREPIQPEAIKTEDKIFTPLPF